jgi:DNA-binding IclR family transcriptional regulator
MSNVAVTAVERALDIFELFQDARRPLSLTKLAEELGVPKSSCHAIVTTLIARGYLYSLQRPRALYPTKRMYDMALEILGSDPFVEQATPLLERLRDASNETVILGRRQGDAVIYLQVIEGTHAIRYSAKAGEFKPLYSSSIGKALLGSLKEPELRRVVDTLELKSVTPNTVTDKEGLIEEILDSRKRGFFVTRGENVPDVWAVASFVSVNAETFAVAVAGPGHRIEKSCDVCAQLVVTTCRDLALRK